MAESVADYLLRRLREWGVEQVFAYPGDGSNGLVGAFAKAGNQPRFIQPRHEEMAAFQAVGYAKFSGKPGVCLATSGPGAIHLLNGLYDAKLDRVLGADRPAVLDVRCDPEVPPTPPHATFEQIKSTLESVLRGDPDARHMIVQGARTKAQEFLPSKG